MIPTIILASNSPRRRRLLALTGWTFAVRPVDIDERPLLDEPPDDYVLRLAKSKALAARKDTLPGQTVLAADTTVADDRTILGKPADAAEARAMLIRLRGRMHMVYTAITLTGASPAGTSSAPNASLDYAPDSLPVLADVCATRVWMRNYSDQEIENYIASGDPFDKAGAYAIQNPDFQPVEQIEGCTCCVVGLPVCLVVCGMARLGLTPPENVTASCPTHLEMDTPCLVYQALLREETGGEPDPRK
jgi:septum formation protein